METQTPTALQISVQDTKLKTNMMVTIAKCFVLLGMFGSAMQWMGSAGLFRSGILPQIIEGILELIRDLFWPLSIPAIIIGVILFGIAHRKTSSGSTKASIAGVSSGVSRGWLILFNLLAFFVAIIIAFLSQLANINNYSPTFLERMYPVVGGFYFLGVVVTIFISQKKRSYAWSIWPSFLLFGLLALYGFVASYL